MKRGSKHSDKTRDKMRESSTHHWKGKPKSEETRRKISDSKRGKEPWNKGKQTGQIPWNKGKKGLQVSWRKGMAKHPKGYGRKCITVDGKQWRMSHYVYCKAKRISTIPNGKCIHHIDGDHKNNKIENLELIGHGEHTKLHNKINLEVKNRK